MRYSLHDLYDDPHEETAEHAKAVGRRPLSDRSNEENVDTSNKAKSDKENIVRSNSRTLTTRGAKKLREETIKDLSLEILRLQREHKGLSPDSPKYIALSNELANLKRKNEEITTKVTSIYDALLGEFSNIAGKSLEDPGKSTRVLGHKDTADLLSDILLILNGVATEMATLRKERVERRRLKAHNKELLETNAEFSRILEQNPTPKRASSGSDRDSSSQSELLDQYTTPKRANIRKDSPSQLDKIHELDSQLQDALLRIKELESLLSSKTEANKRTLGNLNEQTKNNKQLEADLEQANLDKGSLKKKLSKYITDNEALKRKLAKAEEELEALKQQPEEVSADKVDNETQTEIEQLDHNQGSDHLAADTVDDESEHAASPDSSKSSNNLAAELYESAKEEITNLEKKIKELEEKIRELRDGVADKSSEITRLMSLNGELEERIAEIRQKLELAEKDKQQLGEQNKQLSEEALQLKLQLEQMEQLRLLNEQLTKKSEDLNGRLNVERRNHSTQTDPLVTTDVEVNTDKPDVREQFTGTDPLVTRDMAVGDDDEHAACDQSTTTDPLVTADAQVNTDEPVPIIKSQMAAATDTPTNSASAVSRPRILVTQVLPSFQSRLNIADQILDSFVRTIHRQRHYYPNRDSNDEPLRKSTQLIDSTIDRLKSTRYLAEVRADIQDPHKATYNGRDESRSLKVSQNEDGSLSFIAGEKFSGTISNSRLGPQGETIKDYIYVKKGEIKSIVVGYPCADLSKNPIGNIIKDIIKPSDLQDLYIRPKDTQLQEYFNKLDSNPRSNRRVSFQDGLAADSSGIAR